MDPTNHTQPEEAKEGTPPRPSSRRATVVEPPPADRLRDTVKEAWFCSNDDIELPLTSQDDLGRVIVGLPEQDRDYGLPRGAYLGTACWLDVAKLFEELSADELGDGVVEFDDLLAWYINKHGVSPRMPSSAEEGTDEDDVYLHGRVSATSSTGEDDGWDTRTFEQEREREPEKEPEPEPKSDTVDSCYLCEFDCGYEGKHADVHAHEQQCSIRVQSEEPEPARELEPKVDTSLNIRVDASVVDKKDVFVVKICVGDTPVHELKGRYSELKKAHEGLPAVMGTYCQAKYPPTDLFTSKLEKTKGAE